MPIELPEDNLRTLVSEYGTLQEIEDELFSKDHVYYNIRTGKENQNIFEELHIQRYSDLWIKVIIAISVST